MILWFYICQGSKRELFEYILQISKQTKFHVSIFQISVPQRFSSATHPGLHSQIPSKPVCKGGLRRKQKNTVSDLNLHDQKVINSSNILICSNYLKWFLKYYLDT